MSDLKIQLLGNGPSISNFDGSEGIRVGCNFTQPHLNPDWTMIADIKPVKKFYEGCQLVCPAILTDRAHDFITEKAIKLSEDRLTVRKIVPLIRYDDIHERWGMNSAQHAAHYAIEENSPKELHIWGCDSLWSANIESSTDSIVYKNLEFMNRQDIYYVWRDYWDRIFSDNSDTQFFVHAPEKPFLKDIENLTWNKI